MFREYLNKNCVIIVGFGASVMDGGVAPRNIFGTLVDENEDYIIVDVEKSTCDSVFGQLKLLKGKTFINKKFIIAINFC